MARKDEPTHAGGGGRCVPRRDLAPRWRELRPAAPHPIPLPRSAHPGCRRDTPETCTLVDSTRPHHPSHRPLPWLCGQERMGVESEVRTEEGGHRGGRFLPPPSSSHLPPPPFLSCCHLSEPLTTNEGRRVEMWAPTLCSLVLSALCLLVALVGLFTSLLTEGSLRHVGGARNPGPKNEILIRSPS